MVKGQRKPTEKQDFAGIIKEYNDALDFLKAEKPEEALWRSRRTAEAICQQIFKTEISDKIGKMTLENYISTFSNKKAIPGRILIPLRTIQSYGNFGTHYQDEEEISSDYVKPCLESLGFLVKWFFSDYHNIPQALISGAPVPVSQPDDTENTAPVSPQGKRQTPVALQKVSPKPQKGKKLPAKDGKARMAAKDKQSQQETIKETVSEQILDYWCQHRKRKPGKKLVTMIDELPEVNHHKLTELVNDFYRELDGDGSDEDLYAEITEKLSNSFFNFQKYKPEWKFFIKEETSYFDSYESFLGLFRVLIKVCKKNDAELNAYILKRIFKFFGEFHRSLNIICDTMMTHRWGDAKKMDLAGRMMQFNADISRKIVTVFQKKFIAEQGVAFDCDPYEEAGALLSSILKEVDDTGISKGLIRDQDDKILTLIKIIQTMQVNVGMHYYSKNKWQYHLMKLADYLTPAADAGVKKRIMRNLLMAELLKNDQYQPDIFHRIALNKTVDDEELKQDLENLAPSTVKKILKNAGLSFKYILSLNQQRNLDDKTIDFSDFDALKSVVQEQGFDEHTEQWVLDMEKSGVLSKSDNRISKLLEKIKNKFLRKEKDDSDIKRLILDRIGRIVDKEYRDIYSRILPVSASRDSFVKSAGYFYLDFEDDFHDCYRLFDSSPELVSTFKATFIDVFDSLERRGFYKSRQHLIENGGSPDEFCCFAVQSDVQIGVDIIAFGLTPMFKNVPDPLWKNAQFRSNKDYKRHLPFFMILRNISVNSSEYAEMRRKNHHELLNKLSLSVREQNRISKKFSKKNQKLIIENILKNQLIPIDASQVNQGLVYYYLYLIMHFLTNNHWYNANSQKCLQFLKSNLEEPRLSEA
ncbi:MAG: DUF4145 domain-containing protein [Proteobacteria bacterium]|nr:DUF4145 domain-containing protein [Pseudomonadota bacterium]